MVTLPSDSTANSGTGSPSHSPHEIDADETTPLIHDEQRGPNDVHESQQEEEREREAHKATIIHRIKRDFGFAVLVGIPIVLLLPALILFITTLNLRANLPASDSPQIIANLSKQITKLSGSLGACRNNSTRLADLLHDEQQRVEMCRESEKRLAARVELAEEMLEKCQVEEGELKEKLDSTQGELGECVDEKEELKREMESGVFLQFLDMVGKLGTGGDSWVCSDATRQWSYGWSNDQAPHPTITIQTWTSDLDDAQHSAIPLVFPPPSFASSPAEPSPSGPRPGRKSSQLPIISDKDRRAPVRKGVRSTESQPVRIVGYSITSLNTSGNNGWWRIDSFPSFAVKGGTIQFFAQAAKWYGSKAKFEVTVYWVEEKEDASR